MRPSRDEMLMDIAKVVSQRSTCSRAQVGVVIAREGRVLVTGYNGAPAGMEHCDHSCDCPRAGEPHDDNCWSLQPCEISVHGEANAIAFAARWGISLEGAEMHTTMATCLHCARLVINAGIVRVIAQQSYRSPKGRELLRNAGIALS